MPRHPLVFVAVAALAAAAPAQDALTRQALQRIEKCEQAEPSLGAGDGKALLALVAELDWADKRLAAVIRPDEHHKAAVARSQAIRGKIAAKRAQAAEAPAPATRPTPGLDHAALAQLDKEVGAATHNFGIVPANLWDDDARRSAMQRDLAALTKRLATFPAGDAAVGAVQQKLAALQAKFDAVLAKVGSDRASAGGVGAQVDALLQKYVPTHLPDAPEAPFEPQRLRAFLERLRQLRDVELPADRAVAEQALQNVAADRQRAETLRHLVTVDWTRRVDDLQRNVTAALAAAVADGLRHADWLLATDADDRDQVANRILARGAFDTQMLRLRQAATAVAAAKVHDEFAGAAAVPAAERDAQAAKVDRATQHLQRLAVTTLDAVRMPPAASTDAELTEIATQTLQKPEHGAGKLLRLVVNAPKVSKEKREGWIQPDTNVVRVTVYRYEWDEFQVTTAEPVGDDVWLFVNTFKHYRSGDPTTPVGRWVLSQRFESTRILPANVDK
ncbi:MAG: hypothetical protein JNK15_10805 [Planctomycetes bacterium]|nr:hypothetical protein [Planctomycetota bacterium]